MGLAVWIDLAHRDGRRMKARDTSVANDLPSIRTFTEAHGAHQALRTR
ncbi:hypothetical protein [Streptomyces sp. NPDC060002]